MFVHLKNVSHWVINAEKLSTANIVIYKIQTFFFVNSIFDDFDTLDSADTNFLHKLLILFAY